MNKYLLFVLYSFFISNLSPVLSQTIIGGTNRDPSAILELRSTDKGLLLPRLTLQERDAILNPAIGLMLFNTTLGSVEVNSGNPETPNWQRISQSRKCGAYIASGTWKEFMCHNLGANSSADPFTPSWEIIGNYYQWGHNPSCFGRDNIDDNNPCNYPIYGISGPWDNSLESDNSGIIDGWGDSYPLPGSWVDSIKTTNDPCPTGFRVPTRSDFEALLDDTLNPRIPIGTWTNESTNYSTGFYFGSYLFFPASGSRGNDGALYYRGLNGYYWSSTEYTEYTSIYAWLLRFFGSSFEVNYVSTWKIGFSIRCIAE